MPGMWNWGVCSLDGTSKRTLNEQLIRALDTYFPGAVFGYQEYTLNKPAVVGGGAHACRIDGNGALTCKAAVTMG